MMPLSMARMGEPVRIMKINGKEETKRFLNSLGFVIGDNVTVVSQLGGNMIINVKDTRVAIDKSMANRIMINE
nr:FeoA family protein [Eubacterium sp. 1001713B170207_170306_E7]